MSRSTFEGALPALAEIVKIAQHFGTDVFKQVSERRFCMPREGQRPSWHGDWVCAPSDNASADLVKGDCWFSPIAPPYWPRS